MNNRIQMLELKLNSKEMESVIHPVLIWDEEDVILIDTGYPGQLKDIQASMSQAGVSFHQLNKVLITHQDIDHIGSLPDILKESPNRIDIYASAIEKPFIQGEKMILKITPDAISKALESLPPETPDDFRKAFKHRLENPPKAPVNQIMKGGEVLPFCGGIIVIETPGHTPGHVSFYHKESKTLIAGDAVLIREGNLYPSDPKYTHDVEKSIESIRALRNFDIKRIICYHGGLFAGDVHNRLLEII